MASLQHAIPRHSARNTSVFSVGGIYATRISIYAQPRSDGFPASIIYERKPHRHPQPSASLHLRPAFTCSMAVAATTANRSSLAFGPYKCVIDIAKRCSETRKTLQNRRSHLTDTHTHIRQLIRITERTPCTCIWNLTFFLFPKFFVP